ncbi:DUF6522 family protein (plasmid) [Rhizobium sp. 32-5/1]|uniref:DUF6522 family protein n=1 Tax=Rhizobium sp. 32-5/1 TaxID=3019602 RepID=UPI00240D8CF9|nr:DUF6522 family protein [Rhizobium sp. 32-5/1]WEZ85746.1 DUF6522 family protein [Rhizobium sp. 32-5/1]
MDTNLFVECSPNGDFTLDSSEIASRFGVSQSDFRRYIQRGLVASSVEIGSDEHAGTRRLSLRFGNRQWCAIVDMENTVQHEELTFLSGRSSRRTPRP